MKLFHGIAAFTLVILLCSSAFAAEYIGKKASGTIINNQGKVVGEMHFVQGSKGVVMEIKVSGMPPGAHGLHLHEVGMCKEHKDFKKAKGHIHTGEKAHGFMHPDGPHEGDLPNLIVHKDGTAHVELYIADVSIDGDAGKPALLDADGSSLMIHKYPDDYVTQPIGGSGPRIACGVVVRK